MNALWNKRANMTQLRKPNQSEDAYTIEGFSLMLKATGILGLVDNEQTARTGLFFLWSLDGFRVQQMALVSWTSLSPFLFEEGIELIRSEWLLMSARAAASSLFAVGRTQMGVGDQKSGVGEHGLVAVSRFISAGLRQVVLAQTQLLPFLAWPKVQKPAFALFFLKNNSL